jgi:hypothetical protein
MAGRIPKLGHYPRSHEHAEKNRWAQNRRVGSARQTADRPPPDCTGAKRSATPRGLISRREGIPSAHDRSGLDGEHYENGCPVGVSVSWID